jgi:hypothetical protein
MISEIVQYTRCRSEHDTGRKCIGGIPTGQKEESVFAVIVQCRLDNGHDGPHLPPSNSVYYFDDRRDSWQ